MKQLRTIRSGADSGSSGVRYPLALVFLGIFLAAAGSAFAEINVAVTASPDPARPGETLDLEIVISNDGGFDRSDVQIVLDYPANMAYLDDDLYDGDCPSVGCEPGEQAMFNIATLPAGKGVIFSLPAVVSGSAADGTTIPFDIEVFDDAVVEASGTTNVTVDAGRELELGLVENRDPIVPGEVLTYSLTYGVRQSSGGSAGSMLTMPLPAGTTFVSATGGGSLSGNVVEWSLGNLNPGAVGECRMTVEVDDSTPVGTLISAEATFDDQFGDTVSYDLATRVQDGIPLEVVLTASPSPVRPNETLDFEITVSNTGPFDRTGVVLRLEYPDHAAYLDDDLYDGDCPSVGCEPRERATFNLGTLPAGEGRTFSLPILMDGSTIDGIVTTFEAILSDGTGDSRESGVNVAVQSERSLELALVENRDPVAVDGDDSVLTYTLTYGVLENSAGSVGTTMRFLLPEHTTFLSASDGGALFGDEVQWSLGALNPGISGERRVIVALDEDIDPGSLILGEASIENTSGESTSYQTASRIQSPIPLQLVISASPDPAAPGEIMDVELTVTNNGVFDRTGVVLRLEIPDHIGYLDDDLYDGECPSVGCETRERAVFNIGTLPAGEGRTFFLPVQVASNTQDGIVTSFEAELSDSTGDRRESGESIAVRHAGSGGRILDLAIFESNDPVTAGSAITYTLTYGTFAVADGVDNGVLRLQLPNQVSFVSASNNGTFSADTVEWSVEGLDPGAGGERVAVVQTQSDSPHGSIIPVAASFRDQSGSVSEIRFQEATRIQELAPLDIEMSVDPNPVLPGETLNTLLSVTNTSPLARTGVVLRMEYPSGLAYLDDDLYDGDCPSVGCEPLETAFFNIGTLTAGEQICYLVPPPVNSNATAGMVINFDARVTDSTGFHGDAGDAVMVGTDFDPSDTADLLGDLNDDGNVNGSDLGLLLGSWGMCPEGEGGCGSCTGDLNGDALVNGSDLGLLLGNWSG